jgi:hypothetical protein
LRTVSPQAGSQTLSPQAHEAGQSSAQVLWFSPQARLHLPSPHWQVGQSPGQVAEVSPQAPSQSWLPQAQATAQSLGQLSTDSPQAGWQVPLPQAQAALQS